MNAKRESLPLFPDEPTAKQPDFDGETYNRERDQKRLASLLDRVREFMSKNRKRWFTIGEIARAVHAKSEASVSARLRDLRKKKFGGHRIDRRPRKLETARLRSIFTEGQMGLFEYRWIEEGSEG